MNRNYKKVVKPDNTLYSDGGRRIYSSVVLFCSFTLAELFTDAVHTIGIPFLIFSISSMFSMSSMFKSYVNDYNKYINNNEYL